MKKAILPLLLMMLLAASCNITRRAKIKEAPLPDATLTAEEILQRAHEAEPQYQTINISKCDLTVRFGDGTFTLRASARIIRDSLISISIQPMLGIEVARVEFTRRNFYVYDKMNKQYAETPYDYLHLASGLPIDYNTIQALLTARLYVMPGHQERFRSGEATDSTYVLIGREDLGGMYQYFETDIATSRLIISGIQRSKMLPISATYGDYRTQKKRTYPNRINFEIDFSKIYLRATVDIEKIVFDEEIRNPKINTERYTRIPFNQFFVDNSKPAPADSQPE